MSQPLAGGNAARPRRNSPQGPLAVEALDAGTEELETRNLLVPTNVRGDG
jgi:hypothetical protein